MKPAPKLKNRIFREFKAHAVTLHTVHKAVTIEDTKRPQEVTPVPKWQRSCRSEAFVLAHGQADATEYISALLGLLTGTYAYCGTYWVDSKVVRGTQVTFFPLGRWRWDFQTKSWTWWYVSQCQSRRS